MEKRGKIKTNVHKLEAKNNSTKEKKDNTFWEAFSFSFFFLDNKSSLTLALIACIVDIVI